MSFATVTHVLTRLQQPVVASPIRLLGMHTVLHLASTDDAADVAALRTEVAARLVDLHGPGHWGHAVSAKGVLNTMRFGNVYVARRRGRLVATLCLTKRKPWAIDVTYFSPARRALYLIDMAVAPDQQRRGIGRQCLADAERIARSAEGEAIRLDAYDAPAGAGGFYARCGYREVGTKVYRDVRLRYFELVLGVR